MTFSDTSNKYPMGPQPGQSDPSLSLVWLDQLTQEVLLTVQAFQRLGVALGGKLR
jgi:hypothetical protein